MPDYRTTFWAGLRTRLIFDNNGLPIVYASAIPGSGVIYTSPRSHFASLYEKGDIVEMNIGKDDQAYGILHGELALEGSDVPPHLLVSFLHWDSEEDPVYQKEYPMGEDEVMPSSELEVIPATMLSGRRCLPNQLPSSAEDESDLEEDMGGIYWKRSHVFVSETATVMPIREATELPICLREPKPEELAAAVARHRAGLARRTPPRTPSPQRPKAAASSISWRVV